MPLPIDVYALKCHILSHSLRRVFSYSLEVPSKLTYSHVATWADKYLDSGVSLPMDTAESSGSDYDSDDSRSSVETVHFSYSCVPSDMEVGDRSRIARCQYAPLLSGHWICVFLTDITSEIWSCRVNGSEYGHLHRFFPTKTFICLFSKGKPVLDLTFLHSHFSFGFFFGVVFSVALSCNFVLI